MGIEPGTASIRIGVTVARMNCVSRLSAQQDTVRSFQNLEIEKSNPKAVSHVAYALICLLATSLLEKMHDKLAGFGWDTLLILSLVLSVAMRCSRVVDP